MAPKAAVISDIPDPFEVYNELVRRSRRSTLLVVLALVGALLSSALAFLSFTRPLPVVVTSDDPREPRRVVAAGDTATREIDAKRFFFATAQKLHAWSSADVVDNLTAASMLMTTQWRKHFAAEMNGLVPVPPEVDASRKAPLLRTYVLAKIRNELDIDWQTASCAKADGAWHCKANATMHIEPLAGPPVDDPKLKRAVELRASFIEVPVTPTTLDGLLVDFWDAKEKGAQP